MPNSKHTFNGNLFLPKRTAHYLSLPCALETSLPNRTLWKKGKSAGKSHSSTTGYSGCTILWMAKKSIPIFSSKTSLKWTKPAFWSKNRVATTFKRWKTLRWFVSTSKPWRKPMLFPKTGKNLVDSSLNMRLKSPLAGLKAFCLWMPSNGICNCKPTRLISWNAFLCTTSRPIWAWKEKV